MTNNVVSTEKEGGKWHRRHLIIEIAAAVAAAAHVGLGIQD